MSLEWVEAEGENAKLCCFKVFEQMESDKNTN